MTCVKTVEVLVPDRITTVEARVPDRITHVEVQIPGLPGPPGTGGSSAYIHTQTSALATWTVAHNMGFRPTVSVTTLGGIEVEGGEVVHLSTDTLTILFDEPFSGYARLT